jgi:predicted transglutaminase-like protease
MTVFTIIGLLVFWWFCWELGYSIALACDAKACLNDLMKPVVSELEVVVAMFSKEVPRG